jgi:hypothetical protein
MNELVQILMQKTGLSQDKAEQVVNTVVSHIKARLPGPIASHLDSMLGQGSGAGSGENSATSEISAIEEKAKSVIAGLGGSFGKS